MYLVIKEIIRVWKVSCVIGIWIAMANADQWELASGIDCLQPIAQVLE
jgi:hypothetical protein